MDIVSAAWLAGIIEGEGCFQKGYGGRGREARINISVHMTDRDIVERVARLFGVSVYTYPPMKSRVGWKTSYLARTSGRKALAIMDAIEPFLGERRLATMREVRSSWKPSPACAPKPRQDWEMYWEHEAGASYRELGRRHGMTRQGAFNAVQRVWNPEWRPDRPEAELLRPDALRQADGDPQCQREYERIAHQAGEIAALAERLACVERITTPLRPVAAERLLRPAG
jgi:hypothetical protein